MIEPDRKDLQEFRAPYADLSEPGKTKTNNELFNLMLNKCKQPRRVCEALAAFTKGREGA